MKQEICTSQPSYPNTEQAGVVVNAVKLEAEVAGFEPQQAIRLL